MFTIILSKYYKTIIFNKKLFIKIFFSYLRAIMFQKGSCDIALPSVRREETEIQISKKS